MDDTTPPDETPGWLHGSIYAIIGGLLGGAAGALFAAFVTDTIKGLLGRVSDLDNWLLVVAPLIGIGVAVAILQSIGRGEAKQHIDDAPAAEHIRFRPWRSFPLDLVRADLTADVVASAGREETFPWRLAPIRTFAILASVGMGAPLGTESPAAHLGVAAGAALGSRPWARRIARSAGLGGGAAGVAALMGLPLVGLVFILELGRRRRVPITLERVLGAGAGAAVGWFVNVTFELDFIRLAVPRMPPGSLSKVIVISMVVGVASGAVAAITGTAIYAVRGWESRPLVKAIIGGAALAAIIISLLIVAAPSAAVGPGGGAVAWADASGARGWTLMIVAMLRAAATTAAVAAGGCGGVFVPFLAIGDLSGRAFAPVVGASPDLAGAAGAAGGIAGGYRLPVTAIAMVIGVGGPYSATLTCLATVATASAAGLGVAWGLEALTSRRSTGSRVTTQPALK
ncbi:MAG: chloride channel protein [Microthrixaceae bacterium]